MGNQQTKKEPDGESVDHERLGRVKLESSEPDRRTLEEEQEESFIMHVKRSVENEKIYNDWLKSMNQINDS